MIGTLINAGAVIFGSLLGNLLGARIPERVRTTVVSGFGLFTLGYGIQMFIKTQNALVVVGAILIGSLLGEWWQIDQHLANLGVWLEGKFNNGGNNTSSKRFIKGFLTASLVFCVGPMAILGSIQDGLTGDSSVLVVKAILDGFAAMAFASTLGLGVIFSAPLLLVYQGSISLLAVQMQSLVSNAMITEMSAAGGLILVGLTIGSLLELRPIRSANFLPALVIAPLLVLLLGAFGLY
ncbi:uncharacterized membrane protein, possible Na+ channel or pump [Longilinea arvoryzae]|uniref:Uncharacterized membrane protein, possible Na+ channel or pump n=1 Tax=Longilinea arvoryzae TaxID=360412 RepID=A0A0S7BMC0_9CHLR|nr:DUF554 domain-containing protein [Longilinea arvoryzae]GAP15121.1 uncharacterized membrane protein, possible Na+ channel or pump [Longilinea arvoryzae]